MFENLPGWDRSSYNVVNGVEKIKAENQRRGLNVQALELAQNVRTLLGDPRQWTQRVGGRDEKDRNVGIFSPTACKWCLSGAISRLSWVYSYGVEREMEYVIYNKISFSRDVTWLGGITGWNDHPTREHHDVLILLDDVIGVLKERII